MYIMVHFQRKDEDMKKHTMIRFQEKFGMTEKVEIQKKVTQPVLPLREDRNL